MRNQIGTNKLKKNKLVWSAIDYLNFDQFLNINERIYRKKLREYLEKEVAFKIIEFVEKSEFPFDIVKDIAKNFPGIYAPLMQGYGGAGLSLNLGFAIGMELARIDMSLAGFWAVQRGEVVMKTIHILGSEEQKNYYLPKFNNLEMYGAFCLTEPEYGSNAYGIETSAEDCDDGNVKINGKKRWIGQGTFADIYIVWARNKKNNEIEGYLIEKFRKGVSSSKIQGKLSFRAIQNGNITFDNVIIPRSNKLEKANNFSSSVSKVFLGSRIETSIAVAGMMVGAYDKIIQFVSKRHQFGKILSSFQLIQKKLSIIMGNIQAVIYLAKTIYDLNNEGCATMGMAGMCKAWCTNIGRETLRIAREILGGEGIINNNYIIRAMCDMEALHTAEGTYEMNIMLAGKELAGKFAII